jgi:hypothetical protein
MAGTLKEGLIEDFEDAIRVWQKLGGPEVESYPVPGLPGGPLRLTARTEPGYDFVLVNDVVLVAIGTSEIFPHQVAKIQCKCEAPVHRCDLDDLEDATNAIVGHFFEGVLRLEHAWEYVVKRFDHTGTSPDSEQDPEDWWAQERRELEEWIWS